MFIAPRNLPLPMGDSRAEASGLSAEFIHFAAGGPTSWPAHTAVEVRVFIGDDGATVVQIDTQGDDRLRVNVNDSTPFDRGVESGQVFDREARA